MRNSSSAAEPSAKSSFIKATVSPSLVRGFHAFCQRQDVSPSACLRLLVFHVLARHGYEVVGFDPKSERRDDYAQWVRRRRQTRDSPDSQRILIARVSPAFKVALDRFASARGSSSPKAVESIVRQLVGDGQHDEVVQPPPRDPRSERCTIRLSRSEVAAIGAQAEPYGGLRPWLVALVRSRVAAGIPQFTTDEIQALYASNRELWAIGRNINQVAHAMNAELLQCGQLTRSTVLLEQLVGVKGDIDRHTERVMAMCTKARERWRD